VKLLFDQNLSPPLVRRPADLYPESNHVYSLGIDTVSDVEVRDYAQREGFLIVTKDADFSDLCMLHGFPSKVIWIRLGNCTTATIEEILRNHYEDIQVLEKDEILGVLTLF
jgi:predicted nuclease of predicted toxin-antitoxin system